MLDKTTLYCAKIASEITTLSISGEVLSRALQQSKEFDEQSKSNPVAFLSAISSMMDSFNQEFVSFFEDQLCVFRELHTIYNSINESQPAMGMENPNGSRYAFAFQPFI